METSSQKLNPEEPSFPSPEKENSNASLSDICNILNEGSELLVDNFGEFLSLCGVYKEEKAAESAEKKLKELGLSPEKSGKQVFLRKEFSTEEIEDAKKNKLIFI